MTAWWLALEIGINIFQGWLYTTVLRHRMTQRESISVTSAMGATCITIFAVAGFYLCIFGLMFLSQILSNLALHSYIPCIYSRKNGILSWLGT